MSGGPQGAKRSLERPLDGGVRRLDVHCNATRVLVPTRVGLGRRASSANCYEDCESYESKTTRKEQIEEQHLPLLQPTCPTQDGVWKQKGRKQNAIHTWRYRKDAVGKG